MMAPYPVHRQMLPARASLISAVVGAGLVPKRSVAATTIPGVQNPHWTAPASCMAFWTALSTPSGDMPSTVVTSEPSTSAAMTRQEHTTWPSRTTEQEPHSPCSQASFAPGWPMSWRMMSRRLRGCITLAAVSSPFSLKLTITEGTSPAGAGRARRRHVDGIRRWTCGRLSA